MTRYVLKPLIEPFPLTLNHVSTVAQDGQTTTVTRAKKLHSKQCWVV